MISVIVPAYNIELYIGRCIESVLRQTYSDWELIIVDDGSNDSTPQIIDNYANKDSRIRVFHKENGGVSSARNFGLEQARGDYLSFIDGDDWIESSLFNDAIISIRENNVDVFMFEYYIEYDEKSIRHKVDNSFYGLITVEDALIHSITPHNRFAWSKVFSSKLLTNEHSLSGQIRFDTQIILGEDSLFIIEAICNANKAFYSSNAYYHYDQRDGSAVRSKFNEKKLSGLVAYKKVINLFDKYKYRAAYEYACGEIMNLGIQLSRHLIVSGDNVQENIEIIQSYISPYRKIVVFSRLVDKTTKIKAIMSGVSLRLTCNLLLKRGS